MNIKLNISSLYLLHRSPLFTDTRSDSQKTNVSILSHFPNVRAVATPEIGSPFTVTQPLVFILLQVIRQMNHFLFEPYSVVTNAPETTYMSNTSRSLLLSHLVLIVWGSLVIMYMRGSFHLSTSATLPRNILLADTTDCNCGHFCSTCSTGFLIRHFTWSFVFDSSIAFLKTLVPIRLWILYSCRRHHHLQEELEIYCYLNKPGNS